MRIKKRKTSTGVDGATTVKKKKDPWSDGKRVAAKLKGSSMEDAMDALALLLRPGQLPLLADFCRHCDPELLVKWVTVEYSGKDCPLLGRQVWSLVKSILQAQEEGTLDDESFVRRMTTGLLAAPVASRLVGCACSADLSTRAIGLDVLKHMVITSGSVAIEMTTVLQPHLGQLAASLRIPKKSDGTRERLALTAEFLLTWMCSLQGSHGLAKILGHHELLSNFVAAAFGTLSDDLLDGMCRIVREVVIDADAVPRNVKMKIFNFRTLASVMKVFDRGDLKAQTLDSVADFVVSLCSKIRFHDPSYGMSSHGVVADNCKNPLVLTVVKSLASVALSTSAPARSKRCTRVLIAVLADFPDLVHSLMAHFGQMLLNPTESNRLPTVSDIISQWLSQPAVLSRMVKDAQGGLGVNCVPFVLSITGLTVLGPVVEKYLKSKHDLPGLTSCLRLCTFGINALCASSECMQEHRALCLRSALKMLACGKFMQSRIEALVKDSEMSEDVLGPILDYLKSIVELDVDRLYGGNIIGLLTTLFSSDLLAAKFQSKLWITALDVFFTASSGEWTEFSKDLLEKMPDDALDQALLLIAARCSKLTGHSQVLPVLFHVLARDQAIAALHGALWEPSTSLDTLQDVWDLGDLLLPSTSSTEEVNSMLAVHMKSLGGEEVERHLVDLYLVTHDDAFAECDRVRSDLTAHAANRKVIALLSKSTSKVQKYIDAVPAMSLGARLIDLGCLLFRLREIGEMNVSRNGIITSLVRSLPCSALLDFVACLPMSAVAAGPMLIGAVGRSETELGAVSQAVVHKADPCDVRKALVDMAAHVEISEHQFMILLAAFPQSETLPLLSHLGATFSGDKLKPFANSLLSVILKDGDATSLTGTLKVLPHLSYYSEILKKYPKLRVCSAWQEPAIECFHCGPSQDDLEPLVMLFAAQQKLQERLQSAIASCPPSSVKPQQLLLLSRLLRNQCSDSFVSAVRSFSKAVIEAEFWTGDFVTSEYMLELLPLLKTHVEESPSKEFAKLILRLTPRLSDLASLTVADKAQPLFDQWIDFLDTLPLRPKKLQPVLVQLWRDLGHSQLDIVHLVRLVAKASIANLDDVFSKELVLDILERHHSKAEYLDVVLTIVRHFKSLPGFSASESLAFMLSHSLIPVVFLDNKYLDLKCLLAEIILEIASNLQSANLRGDYLTIFLAAYSATLSKSDRLIFRLVKLWASRGVDFAAFSPITFGPNALQHYAQLRKHGAALWNRPTSKDVIDCIDSDHLWNSVVHFPPDIDLTSDVNDDESFDLVEADQIEDGYRNRKTGTGTEKKCVYDPRFLLPLLAHLVDPGGTVSCVLFVQRNCLAYALAALSSGQSSTRAIGYLILSRYRAQVKGALLPGNKQLYHFLSLIRNSVEKENQRWPKIITMFLAKIAECLIDPNGVGSTPVGQRLVAYATRNVRMELDTFPLLHDLFQNESLEYAAYRIWFLEFLVDGLRDAHSYQILKKGALVENLLAYFASPVPSLAEKAKFCQIVRNLSGVRSIAGDLVKNHGLIPWFVCNLERFTRNVCDVLLILCKLWQSLSAANSLSPTLASQFVTMVNLCCQNVKKIPLEFRSRLRGFVLDLAEISKQDLPEAVVVFAGARPNSEVISTDEVTCMNIAHH